MDIPLPKKERSFLARYIWFLASGVLLLLLGFSLLSQGDTATVDSDKTRLAIVERRSFVRESHGFGRLVAVETRWLTASWPGRVEELRSHPGDEVGPDSVILQIENPEVDEAAREAASTLEISRAEALAQRAEGRSRISFQTAVAIAASSKSTEAALAAAMDRKLLEDQLVSQLVFERSKGNAERMAILAAAEEQRVEAVRASVTASEAAIDARLRQLERAVARHGARQEESLVRAGLAGIVRELTLKPGQWVEEGQLLARIAGRGEMRAEVQIREAEASLVREGQSARLEILGVEIPSRVESIDPASENGTVKVLLSILGPLPAGAALDMTVEGSVLIDSVDEKLTIPLPSFYRPGVALSIFRLDPNGSTARRTEVTLGRRSRHWVEVLGGLVEGDQVILSDHPEVAASDLIRLES